MLVAVFCLQNFLGPEFVKMASDPCVTLSVPSSIMVCYLGIIMYQILHL